MNQSEISESNPESEEHYVPDRVLILFMGGTHQHAITSIQHYAPDAVHIITSGDFREAYVRRLNEWSRKYGFRKGCVQAVSDLFEPTSVPSLLSKVFNVAGHEHNLSKGRMETHQWTIGITGGTMHMAAVATLASNILDARAFYVIKPKEGEAIMPNKQIIEMPALTVLKTAMALKATDVNEIMEKESGIIPELLENTQVEPWLLGRLEAVGILETNANEPLWRLTWMGEQVLTMLRSGPMFRLRLGDETFSAFEGENPENYDGGFHG